MIDSIVIRESGSSDVAAIKALYPAAFPDEDLLPIVTTLLAGEIDVLTLVATADDALAGHILFTRGAVPGHARPAALLAPLAVAPERQRQGIGNRLVRSGLERLRADGTGPVYVLGDPAYYGRFGFTPDRVVEPPYPLPDEYSDAWQSLCLNGDAPQQTATLSLPEPWLRQELWGP